MWMPVSTFAIFGPAALIAATFGSLPPAVVLARRAVGRGGVELGALLGHADQPGVVASDADGYELVGAAERVELGRVGLQVVEVLGLGHVLGRRARAAR